MSLYYASLLGYLWQTDNPIRLLEGGDSESPVGACSIIAKKSLMCYDTNSGEYAGGRKTPTAKDTAFVS
jgi:hypothetical protein